MNLDRFIVPPDQAIKLKDYSASYSDGFLSKQEAPAKLRDDIVKLADLQSRLAAQSTYALLVIIQGMDAAGKDSTIKHVMSGVNPSGCQVKSFKVPSDEELAHDYLWRHVKSLPERGKIGIFNRSHYEEVIVVRVHPELLERQHIHPEKKHDKLWATRYGEINQFEEYLVENGTEVLKFFLHVSKSKQKKRFLERLEMTDKNWKFSEADVRERERWDDYVTAYEHMLSNTSTRHAPWYIVPADRKWFTHLVVANAIVEKLKSLDLHYPKLDRAHKQALENARKILLAEEE